MAMRGTAGVTLTELMIAVAVISIAAIGLVSSFIGVQRALQAAKDKTMASNLAQEKMQIIQQQTYFRIIPTSSPSYLSDGTPYDASVFPPESILEGGVDFRRYTYIQVAAETDGVIGVLPPTTPDTGLRRVTVTVEWTEGGQAKKLSIDGMAANPNTVEANSVFTGTVRNAATGAPLSNVLVNVAENVGWRDTTNAAGAYTIRLSPGSFNLAASAPGYFSQYAYVAVGANATAAQDFSLTAMSSGSVTGAAWVNPTPLISQVVLSSVQANGYDVEYIELFNPTTSAYVLSAGGPINLNVVSNHADLRCTGIPLNYVNATLSPDGYYLIANTTTFTVNGVLYAADAYYDDSAAASCNVAPSGWSPPASRDILQRHHADTVYLTDASGSVLDAVGWTENGSAPSPSHCEGTCIPQPADALPAGDQIVRTSSPSWADGTYGKAYDSGDNSVDFAYPGAAGALDVNAIAFSPFTTASGSQSVVAGAPAVGAVVSASDGLSASTQAYSVGSPPEARFALAPVATGTWTVLITSASCELENDTVAVAASGSVYVFPSSTTLLSGTAATGFISGSVTDASGNPISAPSAVQVSGAGESAEASAGTGRYLLRVSPGLVDVTANPGYANPNYVSVSSLSVAVALGQVSSGINFSLSQGGRLSGWVTRDGTNGLQGVTIVATDADGNAQDQEVTDVAGAFKTINLATGTYTVSIPLDTTETSSPTTASATVLLGQTVFADTFTITGALGYITGSVTSGGDPISTGVLVVASTGTLAGGPPDLSSAALTSSSYYAASSDEKGDYTLEVRQSTSAPYYVYGYYATLDASGKATISSKVLSGVQVAAGQTVSGQDLAW